MAPQPRFPVLVFVFLAVHVHVPASRAAGPLPPTYDGSMCSESSSRCGSVSVRYPFYLANETRPSGDYGSTFSCGYTDLKIFCQVDGGGTETAIIQLSKYNYTVMSISYNTSTTLLADADELRNGTGACPVVYHNVTFGPNWLSYKASSHDNLTFFSGCYPDKPLPNGLDAYQIDCPGFRDPPGGGTSLVFSSDQHDASRDHDLEKHCGKVVVAPVLRDSLPGLSNLSMLPKEYGSVLRQGFELSWNRNTTDGCHLCEQSSGGRCAYNQNKFFLGCLCADGKVGVPDCSNSGASSTTPSSGSRPNRWTTAAKAGVAAGGVSVVLVAGVIAILFIRKRKLQKGVNSSSRLLKYSGSGGTPNSRGGDTESGSVRNPHTHLFSYEELQEATDSFHDSRELGDGGFGIVYKGYLNDGRVVAVKRLYNNSYRRVEQFVNEAAILSGLRHPNLVMFYGCTSSSSRELLLVYEFVANGTVADHLHGSRAPERTLSWPLRLNIAVEAAAALTYLHAIEQPIVHRDVKTTNILLDADFHVKVADFGLSRLFPLDVTHVSTAPQGTPGYVDPEYHQCYQLTDKSDVYSFGVVLVELISSKPAVDITRHRNEINLAGMAINKIQKCQLEELVDLELGYESDPATKKMMTMVAELAFRCLQQNGEMRPPIREVLEVLKAIQGECRLDKGGDKDKDLAGGPFSPNTVHDPWDSRATTPNTSRD